MSLNDKIKYCWTTSVPRKKEEILEGLRYRIKDYKWTDFLSHQIDFKEFEIKDDGIEITSSPGVFTAFRPWGQISIRINEQVHGHTQLAFDILPMSGNLPLILYLTVGFLSLWTMAFLFAPWSVSIAVVIIGFWTAFGLVIYLQYRYHRATLINYSKRVYDFISTGQ